MMFRIALNGSFKAVCSFLQHVILALWARSFSRGVAGGNGGPLLGETNARDAESCSAGRIAFSVFVKRLWSQFWKILCG